MHREHMRAALAQAKAALDLGEVPVGAAIVCDGQVIALAHNERETTLDPTAHAEVLAIRRAAKKLGRRRLNGCTLYVTLEPCPMCAGAIVMAGIEHVIYGAADERAGCAGSLYALTEDPAFGAGIPSSGGLLAEESKALLSSFFESHREE